MMDRKKERQRFKNLAYKTGDLCHLIRAHHNRHEDDPERLTSAFMVGLVKRRSLPPEEVANDDQDRLDGHRPATAREGSPLPRR